MINPPKPSGKPGQAPHEEQRPGSLARIREASPANAPDAFARSGNPFAAAHAFFAAGDGIAAGSVDISYEGRSPGLLSTEPTAIPGARVESIGASRSLNPARRSRATVQARRPSSRDWTRPQSANSPQEVRKRPSTSNANQRYSRRSEAYRLMSPQVRGTRG
jgi:hypothetical protein